MSKPTGHSCHGTVNQPEGICARISTRPVQPAPALDDPPTTIILHGHYQYLVSGDESITCTKARSAGQQHSLKLTCCCCLLGYGCHRPVAGSFLCPQPRPVRQRAAAAPAHGQAEGCRWRHRRRNPSCHTDRGARPEQRCCFNAHLM